MHLMILWNSVQTSQEIRTYLTIVNIKNGGHVISRFVGGILSRFFILQEGCMHYKREQCVSLFFQTGKSHVRHF
jgi:hypothetical protein